MRKEKELGVSYFNSTLKEQVKNNTINFHKINNQFDLEFFIISTTFPLEFLKYFNLSFKKLIYAESNKNIVHPILAPKSSLCFFVFNYEKVFRNHRDFMI